MSQVNTQLVYILHKRKYRESSQILDIFSRDFGRLSLMSRGSRGPKSKIAGNLQLFSPLLISWQGKGSLPTIRSVDRADIKPPRLSHQSLHSAMYMNELLMYLLHRNDEQQAIFDHYHKCLYALEKTTNIEVELRQFELGLLSLLGFGLILDHEADTGQAIVATNHYHYHIEHGPVICTVQPMDAGQQNHPVPVIQGEVLLLLMKNEFEQIQRNQPYLRQVKQLMRHVIHFHLGGRPLKSRELFAPPGNYHNK